MPNVDEAFRLRLIECLRGIELQTLPLEGRRRAAVAVPVVEAGHGADLPGMSRHAQWRPDAALLLTRRPNHLARHPGQWAWPGGRCDPGETAERTALRELQEETGLRLDEDAVLGRLDDVPTRSGFVITPVVVWGGAARHLAPDPQEVASVHRLPVQELLRPDAPMLDVAEGAAAGDGPVLRMPVGDAWIAAPTAAVLYQFREWGLLGRPTRVAHFGQPAFAWQ